MNSYKPMVITFFVTRRRVAVRKMSSAEREGLKWAKIAPTKDSCVELRTLKTFMIIFPRSRFTVHKAPGKH